MLGYTEINLENPLFKEALDLLDGEVKRIIEKLYDGEFKTGDVTLKLTLGLVEDYKEYPVSDELGFGDSEKIYFNRPVITHNVSTTLKKQYREKGSVSLDSEIKKINDKFMLVRLKKPQRDLDEDGFLE